MNNGAEEFDSYHPYLTLISLLLNAAFKPWKRRKIEKGRQWKEDKRVEKEKRNDVPSNFYTLTFSGEKKRPLTAGIQFFDTIFKNPDIYIYIYCRLNWRQPEADVDLDNLDLLFFTYQYKYAL